MSAEQQSSPVNPADEQIVALAPVEAIKQIADKALAVLNDEELTDLDDVRDDLHTYLSAISDLAFDMVCDPLADCSREAMFRFVDAASALVDKV